MRKYLETVTGILYDYPHPGSHVVDLTSTKGSISKCKFIQKVRDQRYRGVLLDYLWHHNGFAEIDFKKQVGIYRINDSLYADGMLYPTEGLKRLNPVEERSIIYEIGTNFEEVVSQETRDLIW